MKNIWKYILAGIAVAIGGIFAAEFGGRLFYGIGGYGFGSMMGVCLYLCVVVVVCTGVILIKLTPSASSDGDTDGKSEQ